MAVDNLYIYHKFCLSIASQVPHLECQILEILVERLCILDVDIKTRKRKCEFSDLGAIQSFEEFGMDLRMKV